MIIPTFIANSQKHVYLTSVKKAYLTLTQGFKSMLTRTDCTDLMCTGYFPNVANDNPNWNNTIDEVIKKTFNVTKTLKVGDKSIAPYSMKYLKGDKTATSFITAIYRFITADGMFVGISNNGCAVTPYADESKLKNRCATLTVDTNGLKGPNQLGKDIFGDWTVAQDGTIYPATSYEWAIAYYGEENAKTANSYWKNSWSQCAKEGKISEYSGYISGQNCLARIMEDGWQIDYY